MTCSTSNNRRAGKNQSQYPENAQSKGFQTIKASVNVVETLGKETFLDLSTGAHTLTALLDGDTEVKPRQHIEPVPNLDKIHLFSMDSGEALF
jgi:ABC-type sugar transport system ATPase subunit